MSAPVTRGGQAQGATSRVPLVTRAAQQPQQGTAGQQGAPRGRGLADGEQVSANNGQQLDNSEAMQGGGCDEVVLATAGYDHTIKFWQAHTGQCSRTIQHADSQVNALEISSDGQLLAACGYQHIRMYDVMGGNANPVVNYEGVSKNIMDVGFQAYGKWIFTAGEDGTAKIWDPRARNLQCQKVYQSSGAVPINSAKLLPSQTELLLGDQSGNVHIWNLRSDSATHFSPLAGVTGTSVQCVAVDPRGQRAAAVTNKATCHVFDLISQKKLEPEEVEEGSGGGDKEKLKATAMGTDTVMEIKAHAKYALSCKFSPDSKLLATSSADQTTKVWDTNTWKLLRVSKLKSGLFAHFGALLLQELSVDNQRRVWDLEFSADSRYLFTASSDGTARLWSLEGEAGEADKPIVRRTYVGHQKALTSLAFRDGQAMG